MEDIEKLQIETNIVKLEAETRFFETRSAILAAQLRINIISVMVGIIAAIAAVAKVVGS
jgi:hypothetical protein